MPEILILIHGNIFLMDRIKIIKEKSPSEWMRLVKSISVLPGICW